MSMDCLSIYLGILYLPLRISYSFQSTNCCNFFILLLNLSLSSFSF